MNQIPLEVREHVIYKNIDLKASIGILDIHKDFVNDLLRVRAKIENLTGKTINAEIKVKFLDSAGYEVGDAPWFPLPLDSGEIETYEQIASTHEAVDFRVIIQRAGTNR